MQNNGHYAAQGHIRGHRFWYQSKPHIRLPISDELPPMLHRFQVMALWLISLATEGRFTLTPSMGAIPREYRQK